jgi:chemotaxis protein CheX
MNSGEATKRQSDTHEMWGPLLTLATQEVFQLMLGSELCTAEPSMTENGLNVTSIVGLAGSLCGLISLRCETAAAGLMASKMLGIDPANVGQELWDAVGEVSNMIAGNFKNKIAGMGDGCQLSVPTVITGDDYSMRLPDYGCSIQVKLLFEEHPLIISLRISE